MADYELSSIESRSEKIRSSRSSCADGQNSSAKSEKSNKIAFTTIIDLPANQALFDYDSAERESEEHIEEYVEPEVKLTKK